MPADRPNPGPTRPIAEDRVAWEVLKTHFDTLLPQAPEAREAALVRIEAHSPDLARELRSLLGQVITAFLDAPASLAALETHAPSDRIGPWRLLRIVGRGGMGVVFEAERVDGAYEQRAAVKLVAAPWMADSLATRLGQERRILATLQHPGIARLLDGGTTAAGAPYLVMEFVDGEPVTAHAERTAAPLAERLRLAAAALDIVQYAHERLVVHRDLKPSNVLVTARGEVKLLDFGIAKVIAADEAAPEAATRVFTPGYASPEQVWGEPVTAASDVYSMGVVLYELLAGCHPFAADGDDREAWRRALDGIAPERPSRRMRARGGALRGSVELDAIVLTALEADPARRYPTAHAFADDLRAYLAHRPIAARRPSPLWRVAKFIRRHPLGVPAGALGLAAILTTSVLALVAADRANRARAESEQRFEEVRRLAHDIVFSYQDALAPLGGQALDVRMRLLRDGQGYLDALTHSPGVSDALLGEAAGAYQRIGDVLGNLSITNLGHAADALEMYRRALALRERLFAAWPDAANARALADVAHAMGKTELVQGHLDRARAQLKQARALYRAHPIQPFDNAALLVQLDLATVRSCASMGYQGDSGPALVEISELRPSFEQALARHAGEQEVEGMLSYAIAAGALYGCTGRMQDAVGVLERAETLTRTQRDARPYDVNVLHRRAMVLLELGYWRWALGDLERGVATMEESRDLLESLYESNKKDARLRLDLATVYNKLVGAQLRAGRIGDVQTGARRAEAVLQTLLAEAPDNRSFHTLLASAYNRQAQAATARHELREALRLTNLALAELESGGARDTGRKNYIAMVLAHRAWIEHELHEREALGRTLLESAALAREAAAENPAAVDMRVTLARALISLAEEFDTRWLRQHGMKAALAAREALDILVPLQQAGSLSAQDAPLLQRARVLARRFR